MALTAVRLGLTASEPGEHALYGGLEIVADAFALAGGCFGECDARVGDHPGDDLGHRLDGNVIGVDASLDAA